MSENQIDLKTKPDQFIIKSITEIAGSVDAKKAKALKITRKSDHHWTVMLDCDRDGTADRAYKFNQTCGGYFHEFTDKGWGLHDEPAELNLSFGVRIVFGYTDGSTKKEAVADAVYFGQGQVFVVRHNWWIGGYNTVAAGDQKPTLLAANAESTITAAIESDGYSGFVFNWRSKTTDIDSRAWMSKLADATSLYNMSVPGTHDTCALHGGDAAETQKRSLLEQLNNGVRFIDIRCKQEGDLFKIYHGIINQHLEYGEGVQKVCLQFLKDHPTETIIMSVKREGDGSNNKKTFEQVFLDYIKRADCEAQWYLGDTVPKLTDVRGKIVLFRRFDTDKADTRLGLNPQPWPDNQTFTVDNATKFTIQDQWKVPTVFDRSKKWSHIKSLLDTAKKGEERLYVNFCSGTSAGCYPYTTANYVNPHLIDYLGDNIKGRFGMVLVDFETLDINRLIYQTNF